MAFNTGNPVPSNKAEDLSDNAENLDSAVNSTGATWTDRLGVTRQTVIGATNSIDAASTQGLIDIAQDVSDVETSADAFDALALDRVNKIGVIYDSPIRDWSASLLVNDLRAHRYPATTGDIYIPKKALPFTTGATFEPTDWNLLQGITDGDIINDLSQAYIFDTVAEYKASTILFPVGKAIHLNDRDADFKVIAGTGTGNDGNILGSTTVAQSATLVTTKNKINVKSFGIYAGDSHAITNCDKYALLASYINNKGGYTAIVWSPSVEDYQFSPKDNANFNTVDSSWRNAIEFVDVKNVYHSGYGATARVNANPLWIRGNSNYGAGAVSRGMDESPIQFRASTSGACRYVGLFGLKVITTDTIADSSGTYVDGTALGIAYRGCQDTITIDPIFEKWGTDGLYYGTAYANAFGGKNHRLENPKGAANYRQGISVVGNSNGTIVGGEIKDTFGGSFGYAIDFEPNIGRQESWTITGLNTTNNERGACNHIRSQDITWVGCTFDEQRDLASNSGCVKIDGSQDLATLTNNIKFIKCTITGIHATIYSNGSYIDDVTFDDCNFNCTGDVSVNSQFRINASTDSNFGTFRIINSRIYGNGGLSVRGAAGGLNTKLVFENNEWFPSDENASTVEWSFDTHSEFVQAQVKGNTIDFAQGGTWSPSTTVVAYIVKGIFEDNTLESTSSYLVEWRDYGAGRNVIIGSNSWGAYSYYDGVTSSLDLKSQTSAVQYVGAVGGRSGNTARTVHGGNRRVIDYIASPSSFANQQAPQDGDLTWNLGGSQSSIAQTSYVYRTSLWVLNSYVTLKGSTGARPTAASYDAGLQYLDTTLATSGKLLTWSGIDWVDATGSIA